MALDPHLLGLVGVVEPSAMATQFATAAAAAAGGGAFLVPAVRRLAFPKPPKTRLADHLRFHSVLRDGETIRLKSGGLVKTIEVTGADVGSMTRDERNALYAKRMFWLNGLVPCVEKGLEIRVIVLRTPVQLDREFVFGEEILQGVADRWYEQFEQTFANRQFVVLSVPGATERARVVLKEATEVTTGALDAFQPRVLRQGDKIYSPLLTAWSDILNPGNHARVGSFNNGIAERIVGCSVDFAPTGGMTFFDGENVAMHAAALGVARLGDTATEDLTGDLLSAPLHLMIVHQLKPYPPAEAELKLTKRRDFASSVRQSSVVEAQFQEALDHIQAGADNRQTMIDHQMTTFVFAESQADLDDATGLARKIMQNYGIRALREGAWAQLLWFSAFPGFRHLVRACTLFTPHLAEMVTFEADSHGLDSSDFGEGPIVMFRTSTGSPYSFQFHATEQKEAAGHMVMVGPTGSGKTLFTTFLMAGAMRHPDLRCFIFDRFYGAYVFTTAMRGSYLGVQSDVEEVASAQLNPLQMELTEENQAFLKLWLRLISGLDDAASQKMIARAVRALAQLDRRQRSLKSVFEEVFDLNTPLRTEMHRWIDDKEYGRLFNGATDTLDLHGDRLVAFDMTRIFNDDHLTRAMVSYLMHRIFATLDEAQAPGLIFVDETKPMLEHPMFRKEFEVLLQEARKKRIVVISAFQRPQAIAEAGMGEVMRSNVPTQVFFRSPNAKPEEYAEWGLTDKEWAFIKGQLPAAQHLSRAVLVKRNTGESVILDIDISPIGEMMELFKSGKDSVARARMAQKTWGMQWVPHYLEL